jgi:hypothetical protein
MVVKGLRGGEKPTPEVLKGKGKVLKARVRWGPAAVQLKVVVKQAKDSEKNLKKPFLEDPGIRPAGKCVSISPFGDIIIRKPLSL